MLSPSLSRTTNRIRLSITEHSLHGMFYIRLFQAKCVTHVSGTFCYLCLGSIRSQPFACRLGIGALPSTKTASSRSTRCDQASEAVPQNRMPAWSFACPKPLDPGFAERHPNQKNRRGLNENYGRELLELHTLGVNGGYTQKDVSKWLAASLAGPLALLARAGFEYDDKLHDKGEKLVLGHVIPPAAAWAMDLSPRNPGVSSFHCALHFTQAHGALRCGRFSTLARQSNGRNISQDWRRPPCCDADHVLVW